MSPSGEVASKIDGIQVGGMYVGSQVWWSGGGGLVMDDGRRRPIVGDGARWRSTADVKDEGVGNAERRWFYFISLEVHREPLKYLFTAT